MTFTTTKPLPANGSLVGSCSRNATFSKIATKNLEQSQVTTPKKQSHMSSRLPRSKGTSDSRTEVTVDSPSFCFPLHTSSPKMSSLHRSKMIISPNNNNSGSNISNNNNNNLNDSTTYESQCVTVDVVENASGNIICQRDRRDSFYGAEEAIGNMLLRLDDVLNHCSRVNSQVNHQENGSKEKILAAKEALVSASKQFVTASKLFVKGATESEDKLVECLVQCLDLMDQMFVTTERLALCSSSPLQMQNLVLKVKDVAFTFLQTLQAASESVGKDMTHPSINLLMQQATTLAAVLTALMRTLRVFSP